MTKRPLLRYHGGKWKLAPWIIQQLPTHKIYTEAYGGSASILLRKKRSDTEVYNDLDDELYNLFRVVRERGTELQEAIRLTPFSRTEFFLSYESSDNPLEQARRTVVRSFQGFGSNSHDMSTGFRNDSNRNAAEDWKNYPPNFDFMIERLRGVIIENTNAQNIIKHHDSCETLHYVDPPYCAVTRNYGRDYKYEMTTDDHRDLSAVLRRCKGMVVLSGYACDLYDKELYPDWHRLTKNTMADGAKPRTEVLWLNDAAYHNRHQTQLDLAI